jgi:hypothetical protein
MDHISFYEFGRAIWYEAQYCKGFKAWTPAMFARSAPIALMWEEQVRGKPVTAPAYRVRLIISEAAVKFRTTPEAILGTSRQGYIVNARYFAMREVKRTHPHMSYPQIGRIFNRDHTTVMYAIGNSKKRTNRLAVAAAE